MDLKIKNHGPTIYPNGAMCCEGAPHCAKGLCSSCYQMLKASEAGRKTINKDALDKAKRIVEGHEERKAQAKKAKQIARYKRKNSKRHADKGWRWVTLKHRYGITKEEYISMLEGQGGGCALCGVPESEKTLYVDHCHKTGKVRGILCPKCNTTVGQIETSGWDLVGKILSYCVQGGVDERDIFS